MDSLLFIVINWYIFKDGDVKNLQKFEYFYSFLDFHQRKEIRFN